MFPYLVGWNLTRLPRRAGEREDRVYFFGGDWKRISQIADLKRHDYRSLGGARWRGSLRGTNGEVLSLEQNEIPRGEGEKLLYRVKRLVSSSLDRIDLAGDI